MIRQGYERDIQQHKSYSWRHRYFIRERSDFVICSSNIYSWQLRNCPLGWMSVDKSIFRYWMCSGQLEFQTPRWFSVGGSSSPIFYKYYSPPNLMYSLGFVNALQPSGDRAKITTRRSILVWLLLVTDRTKLQRYGNLSRCAYSGPWIYLLGMDDGVFLEQ